MPFVVPPPSLTEAVRPAVKVTPDADKIRVVDLFAGCGGLTLGIAQAAEASGVKLEVALAVDFEDAATKVYETNFPDAKIFTDSVEAFFDGELGAELSETEAAVARDYANITILVGGPPCQGHSNLNNKTRRKDPKNELYAKMARAAEVLKPTFVVIENVPSVRLDTDQVVQKTAAHLQSLGYIVATATVKLNALGVAQKRRRHVLLASSNPAVSAQALLDDITRREADKGHDLRWAIGDLTDLSDRKGYDLKPTPSADNVKRMNFLLDHDLYDLPNEHRPVCHQDEHRYTSMYGRLKWTEPAQTITSGFGSIGQGRYMHPERPRALTAHEAARIQGFPDYFDFSSVTRRSDLATMIGNAVPPALMREIAGLLLRAPDDVEPSEDIVDSVSGEQTIADVPTNEDRELVTV